MISPALLDACKAFSTGLLENSLSHIDQNIAWTIIGDEEIIGIQALIEFNQQASAQVFPRYIINNLIITENHVVIEGSDSDRSDYFFCDIFHIKNDQINRITSYVS